MALTQQEIDDKLLDIQGRFAYQNDEDLVVPACYGQFNDILLEKKLLLQNQLLKRLWHYDTTEADNCSCMTNAQVEAALLFLEKEIPYPYVAPDMPISTTFKDENITFIFNLISIGCDKACVSDYRDIRITLYTNSEILATYTLEAGIAVIDGDSVAVGLLTSQMPVNDDVLYLKFEVMETEGVWLTIVEGHELTVLKDE